MRAKLDNLPRLIERLNDKALDYRTRARMCTGIEREYLLMLANELDIEATRIRKHHDAGTEA
jgi:hypothetical protein